LGDAPSPSPVDYPGIKARNAQVTDAVD